MQKFVIDYKSISITSCRMTLQKSTRFFCYAVVNSFHFRFSAF
uniref:Uncharacterized protein n=1 Tax=Siphoviridae sp. ctgaY24 TaxID=2827911 RepID=A0A8S5SAM5_9CAUD|nr:MAG TPA: hypothetical protein [Siphoviridae sp. ctgaY24]